MTLRIFRSYASGFFGRLDDETRASLLAAVAEHDAMHAAFRPEGTVTYDRTLTSFRFRVELRVRAESPEDARAEMVETVRARAVTALAALGVVTDPARLRVGGTDMASMWERGPRSDARLT